MSRLPLQTFAHFVIAALPTAETGGNLANVGFSLTVSVVIKYGNVHSHRLTRPIYFYSLFSVVCS